MAEQAHFAKYKISLKNNNKESQQVNEPTSQRGIESTSRRANRSTSQQVNEDMRGAQFENSILRKFEDSRIRGFKNSWRWIDKKGGEILKISPPYSYSITSFLFSCQFLNTVNPKIGLVALFLVPK